MGTISKFIKATGNCRIMLDKVRHDYQQRQTRAYFMRDLATGVTYDKNFVPHKDENGMDFITLEQLGEHIFNDRTLYGYLDPDMIWDLYQLYESMSLNGMDTYKSEIKLEIPKLPNYNKTVEEMMQEKQEAARSRQRKIAEGNRVTIKGSMPDRNVFFTNDEIVNHFNQYRIEEKPTMKPNHDLYEGEVNVNCGLKNLTIDDEPCRLYLIVATEFLYYLEFQPRGQGIRLATATNLPYVDFADDDYDMTEIELYNDVHLELLKETRDDAFTWSVETLLY